MVLVPTWSLGAVVGRRYRLEAELGRGGFGAVFRATTLDTRELVAVKLLASAHVASETGLQRFRREAEVAARLRHPSAVRVLDFGDAGEGTPFIAFELCAGAPLDVLLTRDGPLPAGQALRVALSVLAALEEAHGLGITHRDVKPANVFVREGDHEGAVRLLDFGVAKEQDAGPALTQEGIIIGTPAYMAPEQIEGRAIGPAADLYAVGLLLAEMLSGAPVFSGAGMAVCVEKLRAGRAPLPEAVVRGPFAGVIERVTRPAPEARYASAGALREALLATGVSPEPIRARSAPGGAAATAPTEVALPSPSGGMGAVSPSWGESAQAPVPVAALAMEPRRSGRGWIAAIAIVVVAGSLVAAVAWWRLGAAGRPSRRAQTPSAEGSAPDSPARAATEPLPRCPAAPRDEAAARSRAAKVIASLGLQAKSEEAPSALTSLHARVVRKGGFRVVTSAWDGPNYRGELTVLGGPPGPVPEELALTLLPERARASDGTIVVADGDPKLIEGLLAAMCDRP